MQYLRAAVSDAIGDPSLEGLQSKVPSYEELHAEVQSILVPAGVPVGIQVNVVQPLNSNFAISHRWVQLLAEVAQRKHMARR